MIGIGQIPSLASLAECFGCCRAELPVSYLGLPLGAKYKATSIWDPVIKRVDKRLASWKGRLLSKGRRLVMLNSVLTNLPNYFLSLLAILRSIEERLDKRRDFLREDVNGS